MQLDMLHGILVVLCAVFVQSHTGYALDTLALDWEHVDPMQTVVLMLLLVIASLVFFSFYP
jgi:hypothetical protein